MSTSAKDWQFVRRKKNGNRSNRSKRSASRADAAPGDTKGRANSPTAGNRSPPGATTALNTGLAAQEKQWDSSQFSPRARPVEAVITRRERRTLQSNEERALPWLFHVTFLDSSVATLPVLLGVPRKRITSAAHALAERYVANFATLPLTERRGATTRKDAAADTLKTTITLFTQEDLHKLEESGADVPEGAQEECGWLGDYRFEVHITLVSRRELRCELLRVPRHPPLPIVVLSRTMADFAGAVAFFTVIDPAVGQLRGMHSIAFKFARSVAAGLTPALMAQRLESAGYGQLLSLSLQSNLREALAANGASVLEGLSRSSHEVPTRTAGGEVSTDSVLEEDVLSVLMHDPGEDAVLALEKEVLGRTLHSDCVSDRQLVWGCEAWPLPRDGVLPEIALYDRLLSRKLHAARGVATALNQVGAQPEPPAAGDTANTRTHVLITENGARAARRSARHAPSSQRVAMWWEPRMYVAMVRNCLHHTMDVLWSHDATKRSGVQHVASFARGTPPTVTDDGVADRASNEALVAWICKRLGHGSLHQQALLELLVAGNVLRPMYHRMFANTWRRRWRVESLRMLKKRKNMSREARTEAYCLLSAKLARHVKPPLFYVPDVFTLLVQDLWLFDEETPGDIK